MSDRSGASPNTQPFRLPPVHRYAHRHYLVDTNEFEGGEVEPLDFKSNRSNPIKLLSHPQHLVTPSSLNAHVCVPPPVISVNPFQILLSYE